MPKDHNLNVNYDVFNCNEGVPPEPGLSWKMMTGTWEWVELEGFNGSLQHPQPSTINFSPSSNTESSFDVEVKYPEYNQMKTIRTMGPGSFSLTATGAGNSYARVRSHSVPVTVTLDFPKR